LSLPPIFFSQAAGCANAVSNTRRLVSASYYHYFTLLTTRIFIEKTAKSGKKQK